MDQSISTNFLTLSRAISVISASMALSSNCQGRTISQSIIPNPTSSESAATVLWNSIFTTKALSNALAGAASDAMSSIILHPVDTIKIRTQADKRITPMIAIKEMADEIAETGNPLAPWRGVESKLYVSPQQKLQYFYTYSTLITLFKVFWSNGRMPNTLEDIVLGYLSALQGIITTLPLSATMTKQVMDGKKAKPFWTLFLELWKEHGFFAFYNTWVSSAILCINPAITFVIYEQIKRIRLVALKASPNDALSAFEAFALGAVAKAIATVVTFPLIRSQTMQRTWETSHPGEKEPPSFLEIFPRIVKEEGFKGLFTGLETQIFKAVINSALMLMIKERIEGSVHKLILGADDGKKH